MHVSDRAIEWTFLLNEKICVLRIANALQSHRKGRTDQPGQTWRQKAGEAVNCNGY